MLFISTTLPIGEVLISICPLQPFSKRSLVTISILLIFTGEESVFQGGQLPATVNREEVTEPGRSMGPQVPKEAIEQ